MEYLLGIDIGTYESKGVLTTTGGEIVASRAVPHDLEIPRPGWAEHDAERDWWGDFRRLTRELLQTTGIAPGRILAAACSTIGPCLLPVGSDGEPLRKAILYGIDTRATDEIALLAKEFGEDEVFRRTGNDLSTQAIGPKILWLKRHEPEIYARAARFVPGTSYLVWKLTGEWIVDHYSASTFVPLYDRSAQGWDSEWCRGLVEARQLPEVAWTTEFVGSVTRQAAGETGLPEGLPVIVGTIDAAAEAVSVGVVEPGLLMLMYGSTLFMITVTGHSRSDRRIWSAPFLWPGSHALMAGMGTAGSLTRWFRDQFAADLLSGSDDRGSSAYQILAQAAGRIAPGSEGLVILPYFSGERTPINDPSARGVIFGLTLSHTREHIYRAILEGVGYGIRHHLEIFAELDAPIRSLRAVGGGTRNPAWLQAVSDITRRPQEIPAVTLGASYGDAFLAGLGCGVFSSPNEISRWIGNLRSIRADPSTAAVFDRQYRVYRELYQQTRHLMHRMAP